MPPAVSSTTAELYEAVKQMAEYEEGDEVNGWVLLHLLASVGEQLHELNEVIRDTDAGPGWSQVMTPDTTPAAFIDWLGQFGGVRPLLGLDEASARIRIGETSGFKRGSVGAIEGAARQFLTGTRRVEIVERDGSPWRYRVRTYLNETPDPAAVLAALMAQKPAGDILIYEVQEGISIDELAGTIDGQVGTIDSYSDIVPV